MSSGILLLVGLIVVLALLSVLLPEGLRWLAARNRRQRDEWVQGVRHLEHDLENASQQLARFEQRGTKPSERRERMWLKPRQVVHVEHLLPLLKVTHTLEIRIS